MDPPHHPYLPTYDIITALWFHLGDKILSNDDSFYIFPLHIAFCLQFLFQMLLRWLYLMYSTLPWPKYVVDEGTIYENDVWIYHIPYHLNVSFKSLVTRNIIVPLTPWSTSVKGISPTQVDLQSSDYIVICLSTYCLNRQCISAKFWLLFTQISYNHYVIVKVLCPRQIFPRCTAWNWHFQVSSARYKDFI